MVITRITPILVGREFEDLTLAFAWFLKSSARFNSRDRPGLLNERPSATRRHSAAFFRKYFASMAPITQEALGLVKGTVPYNV